MTSPLAAPQALTEVRAFVAVIPAGTAQAAPVTVALAMPPRVVTSVTLRIPPGPNGEMGFRLGSSGGTIIPDNAGAWIIASDEVIAWTLEDQITSGAWELSGYNTGQYDHSVYVRFVVVLPANPGVVDLAGAVVAQLSAPPVAVATVAPVDPDNVIAGGG